MVSAPRQIRTLPRRRASERLQSCLRARVLFCLEWEPAAKAVSCRAWFQGHECPCSLRKMQPRQGQWLILAEVRWRILGAFALAEPWFFLCFGSFIRYTNRWMFVYIVDIPPATARGEISCLGFECWSSARRRDRFQRGRYCKRLIIKSSNKTERRHDHGVSHAGTERTGRRTGRQRRKGDE